jgi:hypothetical protein
MAQWVTKLYFFSSLTKFEKFLSFFSQYFYCIKDKKYNRDVLCQLGANSIAIPLQYGLKAKSSFQTQGKNLKNCQNLRD